MNEGLVDKKGQLFNHNLQSTNLELYAPEAHEGEPKAGIQVGKAPGRPEEITRDTPPSKFQNNHQPSCPASLQQINNNKSPTLPSTLPAQHMSVIDYTVIRAAK